MFYTIIAVRSSVHWLPNYYYYYNYVLLMLLLLLLLLRITGVRR